MDYEARSESKSSRAKCVAVEDSAGARMSDATAIVGRGDVIARIMAQCDAAVRGHGGVIAVEGGAGIGKTTVVTAVARLAEKRAFNVCFSQCLAIGAAPFWPWTQLVSGCTATTLAGWRAKATQTIAAYLGPTLPMDEPNLVSPSIDARGELFEALTELLAKLNEQGPHLLVIEDVHRADASSALLLVELAAVLKTKRILALATIRSDEPVEPQLELALAELRRLAATISLGGLSRTEIGQLLHNSSIDPDEALIETLSQRTGGNPFFITEIIRSLSDTNLQRTVRARIAAVDVPTHVGALVRNRLARFAEPFSALVQTAAVLGVEGDVRLLAKTANIDVEHALDDLSWVLPTGLIVQPTADRWAFSHSLVRDAIEATLPALRRAKLHEQAVRAYESIYGDQASIAALAHHALSSLPLGSVEKAVALGARAGDDAIRRLAFETAARAYEQTLDLLASGDPERRAELLVGLGNARRAAGDWAAAQAAFRSAAGLAGNRHDLLMAAALGNANPAADLGLTYRAEDPETTRLLERALAALPTEDATDRALVSARLAAELYYSSGPERSRPFSEAAIALARQSGNERALVVALAVHHDAFAVGNADSKTLLAGSDAIMSHARSCGDEDALLIAHRARVFDLLVAGDIAGVDAAINAFERLTEHRRGPSHLWWPAQWRAMRALLQGEHSKAERLALDAFEIGKQPFPILAALNLAFLQFFSKREQGRLAELEATMRALALEYPDVPGVTAGLAFLLAELRQLDEARGLLLRLGADGFARLRDRNWPPSHFMLARVAALVGDRDHAAMLLACGASLSGQCVEVSYATVCLGAADLALAWLAQTVGDDEQADRYYEAAEVTNARIGARSWLAQARFDHAEFLKRRGRPNDADKGRGLASLAEAARRALNLSLIPIRSEADGPPETARGKPESTSFRRQGTVWRLSYQRQQAVVQHTKGLVDIAWLLAHPGQSIRAADLVAAQSDGFSPSGDGGEVLDKKARNEIRERLRSIDQDLAEAEDANDLALVARLRHERDELITASAAALGLGGRPRRLDDVGERARKAVAARIKNSIQMIAWVHPVLGAHLERSIDTGNLCIYQPERPIAWRF